MSTPATGTVDVAPASNFIPGTVRHAAAGFEALFAPEGDTSDTQNDDKEASGVTDDQTNEELGFEITKSDESGASTDGKDDEVKTDDEVKADGDEDNADGEQKPVADPDFTVMVDGKEAKVKQSELIAGYQRNSSYTRKSQALADDRKALETYARATKAEREHYAASLPKIAELLKADEPNWDELQAKDPAAFQAQWASNQLRKSRLAEVQKEQQRVAELNRVDIERQHASVLTEQRDQLLKKLPSWRDQKVRTAEAAAMESVMRSVGYGEDELSLYDHRAILLIRLAAKYVAGAPARASLRGKIKAAPVLKPGSPGRVGDQSAKSEATKRFHSSGSVRDAAKLFETML